MASIRSGNVQRSEKTHKCDYCAKRFKWAGSLQRHLNIHSDERPYKRTQSGKNCRTSGNLKACSTFRDTGTRNTGTSWNIPEHSKTRNTPSKTRNTRKKTRNTPKKTGNTSEKHEKCKKIKKLKNEENAK